MRSRPSLSTPLFQGSVLALCVTLTACPQDLPNDIAGETESGDACTPGSLDCSCGEGNLCLGDLVCVDDLCVNDDCMPGTEQCQCAEGDLCLGELVCDAGVCEAPGDACVPNAYYRCSNGNVHWFDSCQVVGELKKACNRDQECKNTSDTTAECVSDLGECDNGLVEPGEECEAGDLVGGTCETLGFAGGQLQCSQWCTYDTSQCEACGNGVIDVGEDCDGQSLGPASCSGFGYDGGQLQCSGSCELDLSGCTDCGNGVIEAGEVCDRQSLGGASCQSLGYDGGQLQCDPTCQHDLSDCSECGNGVIEMGEVCDGQSLGGASCTSLGYDGGQLQCNPSCQHDTSSCTSCACDSGPCCDGCNFLGSNVECGAVQTEYGCPSGTDPGDDVHSRSRSQLCSGFSSSCGDSYGPWSAWQVADVCSTEEYCAPGDSTCNLCSWNYSITQYQCSNYSFANGGGAGGGEIMRVCASTNPQTGYMTVKARKYDGSTFGSRPYQVRVSGLGEDPCGPATYYFVISDSDPVGIGTAELTFSFPSQWLPGQTGKAYCVTASTQQGDLGYNPNDPQQQSWWWSDKAVLTRECG